MVAVDVCAQPHARIRKLYADSYNSSTLYVMPFVNRHDELGLLNDHLTRAGGPRAGAGGASQDLRAGLPERVFRSATAT